MRPEKTLGHVSQISNIFYVGNANNTKQNVNGADSHHSGILKGRSFKKDPKRFVTMCEYTAGCIMGSNTSCLQNTQDVLRFMELEQACKGLWPGH